jgi:hypothetical protein
MTSGSIQRNNRHASAGVVVTCCTGAPALFGMTKTSGGLVADDWMNAIIAPSGDTSPMFDPAISVSRVRGPPPAGIS